MNSETKYEFKGTSGPWHIYKPELKDYHPGIQAQDWTIITFGQTLESHKGVQGRNPEEIFANAQLIASAPLLLSALIKSVEWIDEIAAAYNTSGFAGIYQYPDWYAEAKSAIEAALNLKTVEPSLTRDPEEDYCSLEQAIELKKQGLTIDKPDYYWVDLSAWGKGYKLMSAQDAEYRGAETKHTAFIDFDTTYPAFEAHDADELLNVRS